MPKWYVTVQTMLKFETVLNVQIIVRKEKTIKTYHITLVTRAIKWAPRPKKEILYIFREYAQCLYHFVLMSNYIIFLACCFIHIGGNSIVICVLLVFFVCHLKQHLNYIQALSQSIANFFSFSTRFDTKSFSFCWMIFIRFVYLHEIILVWYVIAFAVLHIQFHFSAND